MTRMPATLCLMNNLTITTAQTNTNFIVVNGLARAKSITFQCIFNYGSAGTTAKAYIQTSIDGGNTFIDVACFAHTTASLNRLFNLSALTPVTNIATANNTANHIADNTCTDGLFGDQWRVQLLTTGTYATNTTMGIFATARD